MQYENYPGHNPEDDLKRAFGDKDEMIEGEGPTHKTRDVEEEKGRKKPFISDTSGKLETPYTHHPDYVMGQMAEGLAMYRAGRGSEVIFLQGTTMQEYAGETYRVIQKVVPPMIIAGITEHQRESGETAVPVDRKAAEDAIRKQFEDDKLNTYERRSPEWLKTVLPLAYFYRSQMPESFKPSFDELLRAEITERLVKTKDVKGLEEFEGNETPMIDLMLSMTEYKKTQEPILYSIGKETKGKPLRYEPALSIEMYEDAVLNLQEKRNSKVTKDDMHHLEVMKMRLADRFEQTLDTVQVMVAKSTNKEKLGKVEAHRAQVPERDEAAEKALYWETYGKKHED